jgi:hypothetical protein
VKWTGATSVCDARMVTCRGYIAPAVAHVYSHCPTCQCLPYTPSLARTSSTVRHAGLRGDAARANRCGIHGLLA